MIKKIIILGGGTSGLIAALILKSRYNKMDISVIKSSEIGIIGVGEGSTEHWTTFMQICGISVNDLIRETDATFKNGIKFINWNGDNDYYFHSLNSSYNHESSNSFRFIYADIIGNGLDHHRLVSKNVHESTHAEPLEFSVNQFHFNTHKLNDYLLKLCSLRSINIIEAKILDLCIDENGYISNLIDDKNTKHFADFFIDSSGFKRIISSKLGTRWIDCRKYLPMNAAIAFPTERLEQIPSHTISTAMSSGWMWRIPTQERFGNGYVYNDDFISETQAIDEAQSVFQKPIEIAKKIKFSAGYVDKFWIKNCVAIGLSGSFVEPLEASSIGTSIQQTISLAKHLALWEKGNSSIADRYNIECVDICKNIIDFVQLHYFTSRKDSDFWRSCEDIDKTDFNRETLEDFKNTFPSSVFFTGPYLLFKDQNWLMIMHGLKMFDPEKIKSFLDFQNEEIKFTATLAVDLLQEWSQRECFFSHRQALNIIMNR